VHHCASPGASKRIWDWVLGGRAADTDRRSFEARRPHASRSQQHTARGERQERGAQRRRASVRSLPSTGTGAALERHVRGTQEVETVTGHVRREATSRADATSMYAANPMRTRRETGETRKEKSAPKELDNCGHIEGLNPYFLCHGYAVPQFVPPRKATRQASCLQQCRGQERRAQGGYGAKAGGHGREATALQLAPSLGERLDRCAAGAHLVW
jgi:hypothetical protein